MDNSQPNSKKIRVFLVDDHQVLREGLKSMIDAQSDMIVIGQASDGIKGLSLIAEMLPNLVVMDITMPGLNGINCTMQLRQQYPDLKILILTQHQDQSFLRQVLNAGANGYVLKQSAADILISAIRNIFNGGTYLDPELSGSIVMNLLGRTLPQNVSEISVLTKREMEIVKLMAWGHSNKEIAYELNISVKTVETHKTNSMEKLGLHSRADVVRFAVRQGWLQP